VRAHRRCFLPRQRLAPLSLDTFALFLLPSAEMILSVFTSTTMADNADALVYCCGATKNLSNSSALARAPTHCIFSFQTLKKSPTPALPLLFYYCLFRRGSAEVCQHGRIVASHRYFEGHSR
jgi:hypothetical protein